MAHHSVSNVSEQQFPGGAAVLTGADDEKIVLSRVQLGDDLGLRIPVANDVIQGWGR